MIKDIEKGCYRSPFSLRNQLLAMLGLISILVLAYYAYMPALKGGFLFDDTVNLSALGVQGQIDSLEKLHFYLSRGTSGPTGRPISLLSFLLDDNAWPSEASRFKETNLLLHMIVSLCVFLLFLKSGKHLRMPENRVLVVSTIGAMVWALHPLHVSTVMYVVQRMAILSCLFGVVSLVLYLYARQAWKCKSYVSSIGILAMCGIAFCLAVFSKENAAIIPLLMLLLECYSCDRDRLYGWNNSIVLLLKLCALVIAAYFAYHFYLGLNATWVQRDFNMSERLLTQSRVIFSYLNDLVIPKSVTSGLYHDDLTVSKSLLHPITTLLSVVALIGFMVFGYFGRRKCRIVAFSIVFFIVAHLVESTVFPLELYFEHRNYFPSIFLCFAFAFYICGIEKYRYYLVILVLSILGMQLYLRATLWGDDDLMLAVWADKAKRSERAQLDQARYWLERGEYYKAKEHVEGVLIIYPDRPSAYVFSYIVECASSLSLSARDASFEKKAISSVQGSRQDPSLSKKLEFLVLVKSNAQCLSVSWPVVERLVDAYLLSPAGKKALTQGEMLRLKGLIKSDQGDAGAALGFYKKGYESYRNPASGLKFVAELAQHQFFEQANQLLSEIRRDMLNGIDGNGFTLDDVNYLEREIKKSMNLKSEKVPQL